MKRAAVVAAHIAATLLMAGCSTAQKLSDAQLVAMGIREGAPHWEVTSRLHQEGYACFVSGAKREFFDCGKTVGFFPTCSLRVRFTVNDENRIVALSVPEPVCLGTP